MRNVKQLNGPTVGIAALFAAGGVLHLVLFAISGEWVYLGIAVAYLTMATIGGVLAVRPQ